jgi:hypothetical protein
VRKPSLREVKWLCQGHTASRWGSIRVRNQVDLHFSFFPHPVLLFIHVQGSVIWATIHLQAQDYVNGVLRIMSSQDDESEKLFQGLKC